MVGFSSQKKASPWRRLKKRVYLKYFSFPNTGGEAVSGDALRTSREVLLTPHEFSFQAY
jgi:hypothetical protein